MTVQPIPEGFHTVTPHLVIDGAKKALDFYKKAFGAVELSRHAVEGSDKLMHGLMRIGDSLVMLADQFPDWGSLGPDRERNSPVILHLYVEDCDAAFRRATKAGAKTIMPCTDMFWGDRYAVVEDPFGHRWSIGTHVEDVSPEEMDRRAKASFGG